MLNNRENIEKAQKKVEKINSNFVGSFLLHNQNRHVLEQNEPVLDSIIDDFSESYSKTVVSNSFKEIIKIIKNV
jgi:hypothetical protein